MTFCIHESAWTSGKFHLPPMSLLPLESNGWVRKEEKAAEIALKPLIHPLSKKEVIDLTLPVSFSLSF